MTSPNRNHHVFIIRIWRETREITGALPEWRGVIEATHTGEKRYLKQFSDIAIFITPYLEKMGIKMHWCWRIKHWFSQEKTPLPKQKDTS